MCTNGFEGYHRNSGRRIKPRSMIRLKRFSEILMIPYRLHNSQVESLSKCEKKKTGLTESGEFVYTKNAELGS